MTQDLCGCCELPAVAVPVQADNRSGLTAIVFRVGTFASFKQDLLQAIASTPELAGLRTRLSEDYTITLLELWAIVADVLTFYQERIANEGFLRTATLRDSVIQLARLIGYQLRPGVAATIYLAFTLEAGKQVQIPVGLRVQSVPVAKELPQKFETLTPLVADARLNRLRIYPPPAGINPLEKGRVQSTLERQQGTAIAATLNPGDRVLLFDTTNSPEEKVINRIQTQDDRSLLTWTEPIQATTWNSTTQVYRIGRRFRLFGYNAPPSYITAVPGAPSTSGSTPQVVTWNVQATSYAYGSSNLLSLDTRYDNLAVGQGLFIVDTLGVKTFVTISRLGQAQASLGGISDTVTQIQVSATLAAISDRRTVMIYELLGEPLQFWNFEYSETLTGNTVYLPGRRVIAGDQDGIEVNRSINRNQFQPGIFLTIQDLQPDRSVLLIDGTAPPTLAHIQPLPTLEIATHGSFCHLVLTLDLASPLNLKTATAELLGNVADASHGETVKTEVVGNGDAAAKFQQFSLKKKPLTLVANPASSELQSTLRFLVNQVLWQEVPSLYGRSPIDQVYTTRLTDDGTTLIETGDGVTGTRLPSGRNNLTAAYRQGSGLAGRVNASTLTTLLDRPVGLKSVTNPLAASGGADPETRDQARTNAPTTVKTFGRAVSLQDFEDLITATGEVAKAKATWVWNGETRVIHLTVAGQAGVAFAPAVLDRLYRSLTQQRDPNHTLILSNFEPVPIQVMVVTHVAENRVASEIKAAAQTALLQALSFEALQFGQPIHLSRIYEILQAVEGVVWVDVNRLQFKDQTPAYLSQRGTTIAPVQEHLRIFPARIHPTPPPLVLAAEQATLAEADLSITALGGLAP